MPRRKKSLAAEPDIAIKHVQGKIITIPLALYPRYMEQNHLEPMPKEQVTIRYDDQGLTPRYFAPETKKDGSPVYVNPEKQYSYVYHPKVRDNVLIVRKEQP